MIPAHASPQKSLLGLMAQRIDEYPGKIRFRVANMTPKIIANLLNNIFIGSWFNLNKINGSVHIVMIIYFFCHANR